MGNEASLEGEGQPGQPGSAVPSAGAPASISAPPGSGQLIKPSNGAPAGGTGAGTGSGINSISGRPPQADPGPRAGVQTGDGTGDRLASQGEQGQGHVARKNLQVDVSSSRTGRSPSVSPDRGSAPTSPYSVPQIAPMPSSKLCPVCKTADLTGTTDGQPNFNTCTQCRSMVCNQCGFNPNPHLTEVQEWLCLNCQMQRALGMDMTTPRSKSQQQIHSPSHQAKPELQPDPSTKPAPQTLAQTQPLTQSPPQTQPQPQPQPPTQAQPPPGSNRQTGPGPGPGPGPDPAHGPQQPRPDQRGPRGPGAAQPHARLPPGAVPLPGMAKAPSQPDLSRNSPAHQPQPPRQDTTRSAGSSPAHQPQPPEQPFGKLFGFGASLLNQASTLISESPLQQAAPQAQPQPQQQPPKVAPKPGGPQGPTPGAGKPPGAHPGQQGPHAPPQQQQQQQARQEPPSKPKPCCPLCKTSLNVGSAAEPPNYNTCTQCHAQVCNMCGFNPAPHLTEKKEWLCLNCQTQRALSGSMGEAPAPLPQPMGSPRHPAPANQLQPQQKGPNQQPGLRPTGPQQQKKPSGAQVSGPLPTVKQSGATAQTKGPTQPSPQTKGPTQASPQTKGPAQPSPQTKGPTQPSSQTKGPTQPSPQTKGPTQTSPPTKGPTQTTPPTKGPTQTSPPTKGPTQTSSPTKGPTQTSPQTKGPTQPSQQSKSPNQPNTQSKSSVQTKGPGQSKGPSQTKGPAQPSAQTKNSPHPPTAKASSDSAKTSSAPAKTPGQPKSTGNNQSRKQQQAHEKTKTASKSQKEDAKTSPKKPVSEVIVSPKDVKKTEDSQKPRHHEDSNKSSTQSLSDTGYSSDGISSSQGEITGQIREEGIKLSERGAYSPSEITKLESSMRPLLESKAEQGRHQQEADDKKQRPHSLSVGQEKAYNSDEEAAREDSDDELSCKLRHDYVEDSSESGLSPLPPRQKKSHKELTDEEFMRRQILEMSADEDELEGMEGHTHHKTKKSHKHGGESAKEKRRLTQHSSSFEEDPKVADGEGDEGMLGSQGGLRRFKTIELNNTNSYNREMELSAEHDLREPELEMESLTGSPEERSRGEYSSTLPATTPSYTSGTSPTSVSSMEDDSDSSPSRRQRLEDAKQQRKARHRPHGPLLPTIEDSSEEDELREEEELLREQEQMRDLEQQRIRSTARKTKRDKEELRALRRRERSKTPPSNLSPIEDASPTEELRQAAEMEELHRSSCSEYSPSMDSEAEAFEMGSKLYKSGSEYNLPTFMSLYSPTERTAATSPSDKTLKSAEEVYEEMMRKAERMQQQQQGQSGRPGHPGHNQQTGPVEPGSKQHLETGAVLTPGSSPTQVSAPVSFSSSGADSRIPGIRVTQHLSKETQDRMRTQTAKIGGVIPPASATPASRQAVSASGRAGPQSPAQAAPPDPGASSLSSKMFSYFKGPSPPVSPATSPSQSPTHGPSPRRPGPGQVGGGTPTSPVPPHGAHTPQRPVSPRLARQQSSQDSPVMVITLGSETTSPAKPLTVNSSTSPLSSPTQVSRQPVYRSQAPATSSPTSPQRHPTHQSPQHALQRPQVAERVNVGMSTMATTTSTYSRGSMSMENISLCRISSVPGTTRVVEPDQRHPSGSVVDLRAPVKPAPIIMTDQGMDLTSLATDTRRYSLGAEQPAGRHTLVQPLIMNLNSQEQPYVAVSTPTTVSVTVAASMFMSQPKQPVVYGDPNSHQNRVDLGQGVGAAVCLTQVKPPVTDPSIPKIDACLEDLGIQQHQLQLQQQKLLHQQQLLEQQLQQHQQASFARYNLANQVPPMKKDLVVSQTSSGTTQPVVSVSAIPRISPLPPQPAAGTAASNPPYEICGGTVLELKNKPTVVNLSTGKPHVMMVQLDETSPSQGATVTQLVKKEEPPPPPQVLDLTGQIKPENQVACCDVVYKLPFAGSCAGSFSQRPPTTTMDRTPTTEPSQVAHPPPAPHHNAGQQQPAVRESYQMAGPQGAPEERKPYPAPPPGRIFPSMSDTNLSEVGLHYPQRNEPGDLAVDLRTMSQSYEGGYLGMGAQYGSYTDLRHQGDVAGPALPLRRYGSMSNINSEYGYGPHDPAGGPQDPNLAQYSATTAREISRMCAALSSMDQFGSRYGSNPEYMQYGTGRGGPMGRLNLQQSLASIRANLIYGPDGRPLAHGQALTNLISARQASIRALYPSALRGADGMTYSTINTPIASTLPITTQPSSVLNPMPRGIYRPYPTGVTAVPLASLTRLPHVTPRMPPSTQGPYGYPTPSQFSATAPGSLQTTGTAVQDTPMYLGKPSATAAMHTVATLPPTQTVTHLGAQSVQSTGASIPAMQVYPAGLPANQQGVHSQIPMQNITSLPQAQSQVPPQMQAQAQQQVQAQQLPVQTQALSLTHNQPQMQPATHSQPQALVQPQTQAQPQAQPQPPPQAPAQPQPTPQTADPAASAALSPPANAEMDKEEERLKVQQEQTLQLERERVELENLRQLRLHEELERDRLELQRHREKEQLLVQREIQELQSIKQQVLHQQQAERETQLVMQREQLAQQRMQLDQIQNLQQQLQQQLQEQKRQKTAAVEAAAAAAAAEAAAASAAAVAAATTAQNAIQGVMVGAAPQGFIICDQSGRVIQQEGQSVQFWQDGQVVQAVVATRLPSSTSEMSLRNSEEQGEPRAMKKQNSMPRLRDGGDDEQGKRIADSCVQTDDEDGEERYMSRRAGRRTRRIADCSVQTDDEDQAEWEQPVRRRRSRPSKHSDSGADHKSDGAPKVSSSSIAVQTTNNSSCQTEPDQLGRVSPAIHITMAETSKVELLHYISAPERTRKGESLACQTEPEVQSQGVVTPQLSVPTTISPYTTSLQMVGASPTDPSSQRQGVAKFERRKPDPLDIGYQQGQQQTDSPSRQPPKSPQVLYSPVSPLSPHRMLETTFASQERLNKAHVTPQQKAFTAESPQRHQNLPRPIKSVQRSMSDPKPLSPTSEDPAKNRFSPYHQQALSNSQMATLQQQQNSLMRKVKRTLPSPPPEEAPLPIVTPAMSHMYSSPGMPQRVLPRPNQGVTKAGLLHELKAVEQESSKLRKQQAELEEEEKEIDAKLRYLELGITQRKETLVKERERRELAYMRCMGDPRDYMSDSELNNLRMVAAAGTFDGNGLLSRPSTAPLSQFPNDLNAASQYGSSSAFMTYPYPQSQPPPTQQPSASYQQIGFQPPQYPTASQPQPGTFQPHPPQGPGYQTQGAYSSHTYNQPSYQTDMGMPQHGHQGFQPAGPPIPGQNLPYPSPSSYHLQPQAEILTVHQRPRQTSLADLEQKLPTNYEVISNPAVSVATSAPDAGFGSVYSAPNAYGQYRPPEPGLTHSMDSPPSAYAADGVYASNLEQNIPRNYVMIDDISELTKENAGQPADALGHPTGGRYGSENGPARGTGYEESVDAYGRPTATTGYHQQGPVDSRTGTSSYYYDDYKHSTSRSGTGSQKHPSKNLAPAVVSSKRSKHRKQGMEQKVSKFSPIEEARDVESDLASYTMTTSTGGSCTVVSRSKKLQDDITYGLKKNVYDQQKYYGSSSREALEEEDRMYSSGRSRSTGYGMDKISSRDTTAYRSKSYERDAMERSQRGSRSGRPPMRTQNSEEESPLSPVGKPVGIGRGTGVVDPHDVRNQYGSSHSLPDVQDHHMKDIPRSHVYKPDDPYLVDDMHCAVSDSEAYHLGQEETDWFEKPREARSDRSRHHGTAGHSSTGRRANVKHTYHDYDEPPEEDGWTQDEYNQRQPSSTSSRDHRHHGSSSGRHPSSRHSSEEPRPSRSSRAHPKDPSTRADGRGSSSGQKRGGPDGHSSHRDLGDYSSSRDPASAHHGTGGRGQRGPGSSSRRQDPSAGPKPQQQQQPPQGPGGQQRSAGQPPSGRQPGSLAPEGAQQVPQQQQQQQPQQPQQRSQQQQPQPQPQAQPQQSQQHSQPPQTTSGGPHPTPAPTTGPGAVQQQAKPGQAPGPASAQGRQPTAGPGAGQPPATAAAPPAAAAAGMKPAAAATGAQPPKTATPPLTGIGSKAPPVGIGSRPGGIGSAAAAPPPAEGDNVLTKILGGGGAAAEQAGKLGDAVSALGKKFTSFW